MAARSLLALTFALIVGLSLTRTAALLINYGAPMRIYKALPQVWSTRSGVPEEAMIHHLANAAG